MVLLMLSMIVCADVWWVYWSEPWLQGLSDNEGKLSVLFTVNGNLPCNKKGSQSAAFTSS